MWCEISQVGVFNRRQATKKDYLAIVVDRHSAPERDTRHIIDFDSGFLEQLSEQAGSPVLVLQITTRQREMPDLRLYATFDRQQT